ncbi:MAG TPA: type II secretion system protein [Tepidisphaeraceae bacterium]|nr:type II secretion system protein [Tepidisphaeraceae bacterium]
MKRGFTWIELLAVIAIVAILLAIFVPYISALRENANRSLCADHLRQLRTALQDYAQDNENLYPRTIYDPALDRCGYTAFTGVYAANPFQPVPSTRPTTRGTTAAASLPAFFPPGSVQPSDVTASLWLLVRGGYVTDLKLFLCPSAGGVPDIFQRGQARSNFRRAINLGYSYASPFSGASGYRFSSDALEGGFALMADINPGTAASVPFDASPEELARGNSPNHGGAGQNVLFADGSVAFESTPYCGFGFDPDQHVAGDNIFTALAPAPLEHGNSPFGAGNGFVGHQYGPSYRSDSYLVPVAGEGPP